MGRGHDIKTATIWFARACFGVVFAWNVVCALQYIFMPADFVDVFQLEGQAGQVAVAGLGVAFLMWNCTFPAFLIMPDRFMCLGVVAIVQQIVGIVGEAWILLSLAEWMPLDAAIERFLFFDVMGLALMLVSFMLLARSIDWEYRPFSRRVGISKPPM